MKGSTYREAKGMPYVRREYIAGIPQPKIAKFTIGNPEGDYDLVIKLRSEERGQIRHNALEAARVAANKILSKQVGQGNYYMMIKVFPHVILRENKMIATAGADRLQEGMRRAFGKPVGLAARVGRGDVIIEVGVKKGFLDTVKRALKIATSKLPVKTKLDIVEAKKVKSGA